MKHDFENRKQDARFQTLIVVPATFGGWLKRQCIDLIRRNERAITNAIEAVAQLVEAGEFAEAHELLDDLRSDLVSTPALITGAPSWLRAFVVRLVEMDVRALDDVESWVKKISEGTDGETKIAG